MMLRIGKWVLVCAFALAAAPAVLRAEVVHSQVNADAANAQARVVRSPHLASCNPGASSQHRLVVFLNGTSAEATQAASFNEALASHGYHVISLDYQNGVMAGSFRDSSDPLAFDHYRNAIAFGGRVNDKLTVEPYDGIEARLTDLLGFLAHTAADDGWREFVRKSGVIWSKVVLAGHSQGAGHAAYLAHFHAVQKVLLLGGPQDYLTKLDKPAAWLGAASKTPRTRFRALLHRQDEFDVTLQLAALVPLIGPKAERPVSFTDEVPRTDPAPAVLVSERPLDANARTARDAGSRAAVVHASLVRTGYEPVWLYLLAH